MKPRDSLKTKIILGITTAEILLATALVINMFILMNYLNITILRETMRPMAKIAALAVQGNLETLAERISLLRENGVFTDTNAGREEKQIALEKAVSDTEFIWIGLYSAEGKLETGTAKSPFDLDADFLGAMQNAQNPVISDVQAPGDRPDIIIGTPVFSGGKIINYLAESYKYDVLNGILENLNISLNSRAYITRPEPERMDQTDSVRLGSGPGQKILSFAPVRGTPWILVIEVPLSDFTAPIQGDIIISVSIILIMLLFLTVAANIFIAHILTEPLKIITENAHSITRGIFKGQLPGAIIRREDEIGLLARAFVSMSQSIETVIGEIDQIALAIGTGRLDNRPEFSNMEGDFYRIVSGANNALDVICAHLDAIPVALALFNEKKEMTYHNYAMNEFLLMHDFTEYNTEFLEQIAGSGVLSPDQTIDPRAEAIFDSARIDPEPFIADIALLGHEGGSNYSLTIQRTELNKKMEKSVCAILLLTDVTMLTRAKIDAEAASYAKSDFLSRMSHEIRTPLNAVIGMTQIAKSTGDMEKIRGCLDQIENSSNHLLGVINDILDFSKIESGKLLLDNTDFSLSEDLAFVISMMLPKAREREITLRLSAENIQNDCLAADSLRLNQVLINLISNAVKFSPKGSEIAVNVRELGSENGFSTYRFEVIDHGIGISDYQASKLFRPFEQADGSITRNYGGTGLGLVICKNLVEMMGGKISLESKEGEGSIFIFTIFCASKPAAAKETGDQEGALSDHNYDFSGKRCLVVDDIEINREIILELLGSTNLAMETAGNGQEAVEKFKSKEAGYFDLILMDMQMPVMDGCTATREIRRIEKERAAEGQKSGREIPIIAMTANVMHEDILKALDSGMNGHLGKPIELETTLKTIQEQLSKAN